MSQHLTPGRQAPAATIALVQEYCCGLRQKCLQQACVSKQLVPRWLHCLVRSGETFGTSDLVGKMCHWRLASEVIPSASSCLLLCFLTIQDVRNSSHALPLPGSEMSCQVGVTSVAFPVMTGSLSPETVSQDRTFLLPSAISFRYVITVMRKETAFPHLALLEVRLQILVHAAQESLQNRTLRQMF